VKGRIADNRWHPHAAITADRHCWSPVRWQVDRYSDCWFALSHLSAAQQRKTFAPAICPVNPESYGQPGTARCFPELITSVHRTPAAKVCSAEGTAHRVAICSLPARRASMRCRAVDYRNHPAISAHHYCAALSVPAQSLLQHALQRPWLSAQRQLSASVIQTQHRHDAPRSHAAHPAVPFADGPAPAQRKTVRRIYWL